LAELRDRDVTANVDAKALNAGAGERTRVDRSILTAKVGAGSGGIAVGEVSRGFGGGSTGLKGVATAKVSAATTETGGAEAQRSGKSAKAARTREEIELVFDKNKSAIYSLYSRALRENPALQGKVVLEVTIAPSGQVTDCRVVSSELGDPELERKLVARVKMFQFEEKDVAVMTTTKPIEFFPA
jgi:TonB family protein